MPNDNNYVVVNANELHAIAEAADGTRDKDFVLVVHDNKLVIREGTKADYPNALVGVRTKETAVPRNVEPEVYIRPIADNDVFKGELHRGYDAVFWKSSAIRKFVLPYYAHRWMRSGAKNLLTEVDNNPNAIAMLHDPHSDPSIYDVDGDGRPDGGGLKVAVVTSRDAAGPKVSLISVREFLR